MPLKSRATPVRRTHDTHDTHTGTHWHTPLPSMILTTPPTARQDKATYAAMSCEADLVALAECEYKNPHDDGKCEPYRLRSLLCMESVVNPARAEQFTTCLRTAGNPSAVQAKCMPIFEDVLKDLEKASEDAPLPLTPQEKQVVQECDQPDKGEEARMEEGMACFIPRVCASPYGSFHSCVEANGGDIDKCVPEGQQVMECWGDFCVRMYRDQNVETAADH